MAPHWPWLVAGILLAALEAVVSGFFLLWLGLAAIVVGIVVWAVPDLSPQWQGLLFAVLAVASVVAGRIVYRQGFAETDHPDLNERSAQYKGRTATLEQPIVNGMGRIRLDDTVWTCRGPDLPAGTRVAVTGADGSILLVAAVAEGGDGRGE